MGLKKISVTYPDTLKALLIKNLRLPTDVATDDDSLILSNLKAAIDYVEDQVSISITAKTVIQTWSSIMNRYVLKFQPTSVTSIKINDGDDIKANAVVRKDDIPSFFFLPNELYVSGDNVVSIVYTCDAEAPSPALEQLIIAIASMYYNSPEGIPMGDHKKLQLMLNNYTSQI